MILETERLILRPFTENDAADAFEYLHEPMVHCFACMKTETMDDARKAVLERARDVEYYFAITLRENGKVIGEIRAGHSNLMTKDRWQKVELFRQQKKLLDTFLQNGAISQAQCDKSFGDLRDLMEMHGVE